MRADAFGVPVADRPHPHHVLVRAAIEGKALELLDQGHAHIAGLHHSTPGGSGVRRESGSGCSSSNSTSSGTRSSSASVGSACAVSALMTVLLYASGDGLVCADSAQICGVNARFSARK